MSYRLVVKSKFDAAHKLEGYQGNCRYIHGHSWKIEVGVNGYELDDLGMVIDFKVLKRVIEDVVERLDHSLIVFRNDLLNYDGKVVELGMNPTAENLSKWLYDEIGNKLKFQSVEVEYIRVWESDNAYAEYRRE